MKNIHILPTDKSSEIYKEDDGSLHKDHVLKSYGGVDHYNIHIISDEEIKEGDWYFITESISKCESKYEANDLTDICKKIILTTDQDLIKDGVQAIDDEFLEWFVKNPNCESVEVKKTDFEALFLKPSGKYSNYYVEKEESIIGLPQLEEKIHYKIIIPKEESKFENSIENSINVMSIANSMFGKKEEPKQETFEDICNKINFINPRERVAYYNGFKNGAKWQQERSYSEEEVLKLLISKEENTKDSTKYNGVEYITPEEWFEQFKKK